MHEMLRNRPEVTELTAVPDAFTPVIKMKFSEIPVSTLRYHGLFLGLETKSISNDDVTHFRLILRLPSWSSMLFPTHSISLTTAFFKDWTSGVCAL